MVDDRIQEGTKRKSARIEAKKLATSGGATSTKSGGKVEKTSKKRQSQPKRKSPQRPSTTPTAANKSEGKGKQGGKMMGKPTAEVTRVTTRRSARVRERMSGPSATNRAKSSNSDAEESQPGAVEMMEVDQPEPSPPPSPPKSMTEEEVEDFWREMTEF